MFKSHFCKSSNHFYKSFDYGKASLGGVGALALFNVTAVKPSYKSFVGEVFTQRINLKFGSAVLNKVGSSVVPDIISKTVLPIAEKAIETCAGALYSLPMSTYCVYGIGLAALLHPSLVKQTAIDTMYFAKEVGLGVKEVCHGAYDLVDEYSAGVKDPSYFNTEYSLEDDCTLVSDNFVE